jgi:hypothetical protein
MRVMLCLVAEKMLGNGKKISVFERKKKKYKVNFELYGFLSAMHSGGKRLLFPQLSVMQTFDQVEVLLINLIFFVLIGID